METANSQSEGFFERTQGGIHPVVLEHYYQNFVASSASYSEEHLADSRLYDLASLVEMEVSADMDLLRREAFTSSAVVEVLWADGSHSREFVKAAKGSIEKPLSADDKIQKFLSLAATRIGESGAGKLADAILHAAAETKVRSLFRTAGA